MNLVADSLEDRLVTDLLDWTQSNIRSLPWRGDDAGPYEVLVAEIFLKQTRSETVAKVLPGFLERFPDLPSLATADREEMIEIIQPLGLYNDRADALIEIGRRCQETGVPDSEDELRSLPQVGRYVANAVLCFGFGERRPIVDSNVRRVYSRILHGGGSDEASETDLWEVAAGVLPDDARQYNMGLLDFAAAICTDADPSCSECFASSYCRYYQE